MDKKSLFIHAPNIRHGGGLLLMEQLLHSVSDKNIDIGGGIGVNYSNDKDIDSFLIIISSIGI